MLLLRCVVVSSPICRRKIEWRAWTYASSPSSPRRTTWFVIPSMPERKDSRERVMCASWEVGVRFREIARWRSRRESLMWSAKRNSWDGFDIVAENSALCSTIRVLLCSERTRRARLSW